MQNRLEYKYDNINVIKMFSTSFLLFESLFIIDDFYRIYSLKNKKLARDLRTKTLVSYISNEIS